jgi:hypothetical protein
VTNHGRKYGERQSHPIPIWNGILEHRRRMGGAIWEFLWCIDRVTREKDGVGLVLGGQPITLRRILQDVPGSDCETIRLHMKTLECQRYIRRRRTPYGHVIEVLNSQKRGIWKAEKLQNPECDATEKQQNPGRETVKHAERNRISGGNKEDTAVTQQDTAGSRLPADSPVWKLVGLTPDRLPVEFVRLCEGLYSAKGRQSLEEFVGVCMDSWQFLGNKIPGPFVRAAKILRERQRLEPEAKPIAFLPEVPFKPKGVQCQAQN